MNHIVVPFWGGGGISSNRTEPINTTTGAGQTQITWIQTRNWIWFENWNKLELSWAKLSSSCVMLINVEHSKLRFQNWNFEIENFKLQCRKRNWTLKFMKLIIQRVKAFWVWIFLCLPGEKSYRSFYYQHRRFDRGHRPNFCRP